MRKIKKVKKPQRKPMDMRTRIIIGAAAGAVAIIAIILLFIESGGKKLTISNETDLKLERVEAYFVDSEGPVNEPYEITDIEAGDSVETDIEKVDLYGRGANLEIRFQFEGFDELLVDAGIFNDIFRGTAKISFRQENDELIMMRVKASNGLLRSQLIQCDEEYEVDISGSGYIPE